EERDGCVGRDDEEYVVEVVAKRGAEVVLVEARLGQERPVVRKPDPVRVRTERAPVAVPVREADPYRHRDRDEQEQPEDDDHGREEQPARGSLVPADARLTQPSCDALHSSPPSGVRPRPRREGAGRNPPGRYLFRTDCSSPLTRFRIVFGSDCGRFCSCWLKSPSTVAMSGTGGMLFE